MNAGIWATVSCWKGKIDMGKTSSAVKNRWDAKTYKRYTLLLRIIEDADLIQAIDARRANGETLADIVRSGLHSADIGKK